MPESIRRAEYLSPKVLIVQGHPRSDSFCAALAAAYCHGLGDSGIACELIAPADMNFDREVTNKGHDTRHDPGIERSQALLLWCDHAVFVYPNWWGTMPALLKAFIDRLFGEGFAFEETEDPMVYKQLLKGRSAELIVTMDTPPWVYRWIYGQPGNRAMARATLGFCGLRPVFVTNLGMIKTANAVQRARWLSETRGRASDLPARLHRHHRHERVRSWIKLLRLQFYPMTVVGYSIGAVGAARDDFTISWPAYFVGLTWLLVIEAITVFTNEYFDLETDRRNKNAGMFNGGSRVLVDGGLDPTDARRAAGILAIVALALTAVLCVAVRPGVSTLAVLIAGAVIAIGYTVPPLKLVYRGAGELTVATTHSFFIILCGYALQTDTLSAGFPWLVSLPLFFATVPAITLSALPDYDADRSVDKKTLPVLLGPKAACIVAIVSTIAAALCGLGLLKIGVYHSPLLVSLAAVHAIALAWAVRRFIDSKRYVRKIDGLMILALTFVVWFGVIPLLHSN